MFQMGILPIVHDHRDRALAWRGPQGTGTRKRFETGQNWVWTSTLPKLTMNLHKFWSS